MTRESRRTPQLSVLPAFYFGFDDAEQAIEQRLRGLDDYPPTGDPELSRLGEPVLQVRAFPDPAFAAETPRQSCFSGAIFKNQA